MARREVVVEVSGLCVRRNCAVAILREYGAIQHMEVLKDVDVGHPIALYPGPAIYAVSFCINVIMTPSVLLLGLGTAALLPHAVRNAPPGRRRRLRGQVQHAQAHVALLDAAAETARGKRAEPGKQRSTTTSDQSAAAGAPAGDGIPTTRTTACAGQCAVRTAAAAVGNTARIAACARTTGTTKPAED
jgi:hypothetical protein